MLHVSLYGKWGQFPGFRVWQGHVGQCAGQAALLLYFSGLCNGARLYLAHSWANKVVYYKWRSQLGLEPQSSGNISTNLVWVSNCSEMWNEVGFMRFQVLLKTFWPALVSSCCFFSFLSLMCLWYSTLNVPQSKGSYETRQKQKPLSITQQTGNWGGGQGVPFLVKLLFWLSPSLWSSTGTSFHMEIFELFSSLR